MQAQYGSNPIVGSGLAILFPAHLPPAAIPPSHTPFPQMTYSQLGDFPAKMDRKQPPPHPMINPAPTPPSQSSSFAIPPLVVPTTQLADANFNNDGSDVGAMYGDSSDPGPRIESPTVSQVAEHLMGPFESKKQMRLDQLLYDKGLIPDTDDDLSHMMVDHDFLSDEPTHAADGLFGEVDDLLEDDHNRLLQLEAATNEYQQQPEQEQQQLQS